MATYGEDFRRDRTQEVAGSSPASSIIKRPANAGLLFFDNAYKIGRNDRVVKFWSSSGDGYDRTQEVAVTGGPLSVNSA